MRCRPPKQERLGAVLIYVVFLLIARLTTGLAPQPAAAAPSLGPTRRIERVTTTERALDVLAFRTTSCKPPLSADPSVAKTLARTEAGGGATIQHAAVSEEDGSVIGAVDARFIGAARGLTFELPPRLHVENLRVDVQYRRRGIGTALLAAVDRYARTETSAEMVTLKVERQNEHAVVLYEKEGFAFLEGVHAGFMMKNIDR